MADDISKTHPYTCNSCAVAFRNSDAQRTHMRTDWHRYNLKRRIADLPAVSSEDYNDKVLAAQATTKAAQAQAAFVRSCPICQKTYYSENAYQNHLLSQKHKVKSASQNGSVVTNEADEIQDPEAKEELASIVAGMKKANIRENDPLSRRPAPGPEAKAGPEHPLSPEKPVTSSVPLSRCLFCNLDSPSIKTSVEHMTKLHGLFIPERNYLVDPEGMLAYMQAKIRENHECLSCHKLKNTTDGIQTHMRDKGHCKIAFETEEEMLEVGQFYDFTSTYSDDEEDDEDDSDEEMEDRGGAKVDGAEEGWETDSSYDSDDSNAASTSRKNRTGGRQNTVMIDDNEMYLPSGRVAGHRSLKKYFRQNLHSYPSHAERTARAQRLIEDKSDEEMEDASAGLKSQALLRRGEAGMLGVTDAEKRQVKTAEQKSRTVAQRQQNRYQAKLEKQHNSQKHFRDPLLQ